MRRGASRAGLAALLLLSACSAGQDPSPLYVVDDPVPPALCRIGPDDGPPLADRGIGGTGAPVRVVDRGIGGTGGPTRVADRGIGGTGIIAVITGFASICLGGLEVALDDTVPVTLNGAPVPASSLRAGQLAIVDASGTGTELGARAIALRHEISGPVESVGTDGRLRVAGQPVWRSAATLGVRNPQVGDWVAVSGLRAADGVVRATRIDSRDPGEVLVRGRTVATRDGLRIGGLRLRPQQATSEAGFVTATGQYRGGVLDAARLAPDRLATDPAAAFPEATRRILVESYAVGGTGGLRLGSGAVLPAAPGLGGAAPSRALVEIERQPGGGFRAIGLRPQGPAAMPGGNDRLPFGPGAGRIGDGPAMGGPGSRQAFQPAPVPRRMPGPMGGPGGGIAPVGGRPVSLPNAAPRLPGGEGMPPSPPPGGSGGLSGGGAGPGGSAPVGPRPPR